MVLAKGYDRAADYWALGVLLFELHAAATPFADEYITMTYQKIVNAEEHLTFPDGMDPLLVGIIRRLLAHDPQHRLGYGQKGMPALMEDPFFAELDWLALKKRTIVPPYRPTITSELDSSNFFDFDQQRGHENVESESDDEYTGQQDYFELF